MTESTPGQDRSMAISTRKLNLWYGTFQALYDVDLAIRQGRITSMIGPSGCGKTTFLRSVNRINERLGYVKGRRVFVGSNVPHHLPVNPVRRCKGPQARRAEPGNHFVTFRGRFPAWPFWIFRTYRNSA